MGLNKNPALTKKEEYIFSILTKFQIPASFVSELDMFESCQYDVFQCFA